MELRTAIQTERVSQTLRSMVVGEAVIFTPYVNENTLRNAATRLKTTLGRTWEIAKNSQDGSFTVRRTS